jgi:hypothetical protein
VLDVGGGSGVYASWLAGLGYQVHLVDPVPLHREQAARLGGFTVAAGDARDLARDGLAAEVTDAGLRLIAVLPVEGPLHWAPGIRDRLAHPDQRQLILDCLAALEQDPAMAGATSHLLAIGTRPSLPQEE